MRTHQLELSGNDLYSAMIFLLDLSYTVTIMPILR